MGVFTTEQKFLISIYIGDLSVIILISRIIGGKNQIISYKQHAELYDPINLMPIESVISNLIYLERLKSSSSR